MSHLSSLNRYGRSEIVIWFQISLRNVLLDMVFKEGCSHPVGFRYSILVSRWAFFVLVANPLVMNFVLDITKKRALLMFVKVN